MFRLKIRFYYNNNKNKARLSSSSGVNEQSDENTGNNNNNEKKSAPSKPTRVPTFKSSKRPEYVLKNEMAREKRRSGSVCKDEEEGGESWNRKTMTPESFTTDSRMRELNLETFMDINPPKLNMTSLIDLGLYQCGELIKEPNKHLDRFALIEIKQALLVEMKSEINDYY